MLSGWTLGLTAFGRVGLDGCYLGLLLAVFIFLGWCGWLLVLHSDVYSLVGLVWFVWMWSGGDRARRIIVSVIWAWCGLVGLVVVCWMALLGAMLVSSLRYTSILLCGVDGSSAAV